MVAAGTGGGWDLDFYDEDRRPASAMTPPSVKGSGAGQSGLPYS
jgi:hypothetical protein